MKAEDMREMAKGTAQVVAARIAKDVDPIRQRQAELEARIANLELAFQGLGVALQQEA